MHGEKKEHKVPKTGECFVKKWKGESYEIRVVKDGDNVKYKVDNKLFSSPSGAAKYVAKQEVNGWRFWKLEG